MKQLTRPQRALLLILTLGLLFSLWVSLPGSRHASDIEKICKARTDELAQDRKLYGEDSNGYSNPTLRPVWCVKSEFSAGGPHHEMLSLLMEEAVKARDPKNGAPSDANTRKLLSEFQKLLPAIKESFEKPVFLAPPAAPGTLGEAPNYLGLRKLSLGLALYAQSLVTQGQPGEALDWCAVGYTMGTRVARNSSLYTFLVGQSLQRNMAWPALAALKTRKAGAPALRSFLAGLTANKPPKNALATALEYEIALMHRAIHDRTFDFSEDPSWTLKDSLGLKIAYTVGFVDRELRMYDNDMFPLLAYARGDAPEIPSWTFNERNILWLDFKGEHGLLSAILIPNVARSSAQCHLTSSEFSALQIMTALQLYRQEKGAYPESLESLKEVGLDSVPPNELSTQPFHYELKDGAPHLDVPVDTALANTLGLKSDTPPGQYPYLYSQGRITLLP